MAQTAHPPFVAPMPALPAEPLNASDFALLMAPFAALLGQEAWAVAVSGGPDSMALAYLLVQWRREAPGLALIVDHALRVHSGLEAAATKTRLLALGLNAEILHWQHGVINARRHEVARKARFDLLVHACQKRGVKFLLVAHHAQDQAETVLMRLARGSGVDGLTGIKAKSMRGGIALLRPLLSLPKERLLATCAQAKISYLVDPSNTAEIYARGRLRRVMPLLEQEGLSQASLVMLGKHAEAAKEALDYAALALLRVASREEVSGAITTDLEQVRAAPFEIARRSILAILRHIASNDYPPRGASLEELTLKLRQDAVMPTSTLHGVLVAKGLRSFTCMREFASIDEQTEISPGETITFDGRFAVTSAIDADGVLTLAPLGFRRKQELDRLSPSLRTLVGKGRARACLPGLFRAGNLRAIPDLIQTEETGARASLLKPWPPLSLG